MNLMQAHGDMVLSVEVLSAQVTSWGYRGRYADMSVARARAKSGSADDGDTSKSRMQWLSHCLSMRVCGA